MTIATRSTRRRFSASSAGARRRPSRPGSRKQSAGISTGATGGRRCATGSIVASGSACSGRGDDEGLRRGIGRATCPRARRSRGGGERGHPRAWPSRPRSRTPPGRRSHRGILRPMRSSMRQPTPRSMRRRANSARAFAVNRDGAAWLAGIAAQRKVPFLHVSSDYVFDGGKDAAYAEDDAANPQTAYGRTKFAGEEAVLTTYPAALVFRTAWVYSPLRPEFVKTMLRLADRARVPARGR